MFSAGAAYFAIVFAAGFILGTIRVLVVVPQVGELAAVLIELPIMLTVSWLVAGWLIRRHGIASQVMPRAIMGGTAFALLMLAEFALGTLILGVPPSGYLARYAEWLARIGLAGQIVFGLIPIVRLVLDRDMPKGR